MVKLENYYLMSGKNIFPVASAFAPENIIKMDTGERINLFGAVSELPFQFTLVKLTLERNGIKENYNLEDISEIWLDYQPNNMAWPLFSKRMKELINDILTGNERITWITAYVLGNSEKRTYFVPRFGKKLDVLDMNNSTFVPGTDHLIKPVFSFSKIEGYNIISEPQSENLWQITSGLYVSEKARKTILSSKLTGIDFEKVPMA